MFVARTMLRTGRTAATMVSAYPVGHRSSYAGLPSSPATSPSPNLEFLPHLARRKEEYVALNPWNPTFGADRTPIALDAGIQALSFTAAVPCTVGWVDQREGEEVQL